MLPIRQVEPDIVAALRRGNRLVLSAPTGSGKTTQLPRILHEHALAPGRIIVLQPRRLAARLVAQRVAGEMGAALGGLVGYQTRHESKISDRSVIRFLTEGLMLRLFQADPNLTGVGAVILDEFHERSVAADASLAMLKTLQERARPDLKLVVMSATLDVQRVGDYLACATLEATGRAFPVSVSYLARRSALPIWEQAADAVRETLADAAQPRETPEQESPDDHVPEDGDDSKSRGGGDDSETSEGTSGGGVASGGDVLVFMPGAYEIRRTIDACRGRVHESAAYFPLHGELTAQQQDQAVAPGPTRKVIVATNVAETSITIPGVRHVIDSGLARINRFDSRRGINVLLIEPISRASAQQRAGRAGRTAPGTCRRLWTQFEDKARPAMSTPEIQRLDLAEVVLWLKSLGVPEVRDFPWLEPPAERALAQALATLKLLGALDDSAGLTAQGRTMAKVPAHPRLSRLLLEAGKRRCLDRAALWAALISERDIILRDHRKKWADEIGPHARSDLEVFERAFAAAKAARFDPARCAALGVHAAACRQVEQVQRILLDAARDAGIKDETTRHPTHPAQPRTLDKTAGQLPRTDDPATDELTKCLLTAYPDHLAIRRGQANLACAIVGGRRGELEPDSVVRQVGPLLAVEIIEVGAGRNVRTALSMACRVDPAWLEELFPGKSRTESVLVFNPQLKAVEQVERRMFEDLVLDEVARPAEPSEEAARILADLVARGELKLNGWDDRVEQWITRTRCVAAWFPERKLLAYDPDDLAVIRQEICSGATRYGQVEDRPCLDAVRGALSWEDQQFVEKMAPEKIALPGAPALRGWKMKVEYQENAPPKARAKIQDLYDLRQTPTVAAGRRKVVLEILGPNHRPVQATDDLPGFWTRLYPELKKELKRKYPRHEWR